MYSAEECHLIAKTFDTKGEWLSAHKGSYHAAKRLGVYQSCVAHMRQGNQVWTEEACMKDAKSYTTKTSWKESNHPAYRSARKNGWFEACTSHMSNPKVKFSLDTVLVRASKYDTWTEWKREDKSSYIAAQRNGWLDDVASVLKRPAKKNRFLKWDKESIMGKARQYKNKKAWAVSSPSSYQAAKTLGVFVEATRHMSDPRIKERI